MDTNKEFYDKFIPYQVNSGINDRIYHLYKRLDALVTNNKSNILEIGCGIGSLTYLLTRKFKHGQLESIDISPESIKYAKQHLSAPNLQLTASNIMEYEPVNKPFDYILMFDVLEHIPIETHELLLTKLCSWMHHDSQLFINIPNPGYILHDRKNNPGSLQEIDQPIFIDDLISVTSKASLDLEYFETYSIWVKDDYQFIIFKKKDEFEEIKLSDEQSIFNKTIIWLQRKWRRIRYKYPTKSR